MPGDVITGYAISVQRSAEILDHTYVLSNCGHVWRCNGRSEGGEAICEGTCDANFANCLATPDGNAGVRYGINGVCHQMANRILFAGGALVSKAKGYRSSVFVWGTFGRTHPLGTLYSPLANPWSELTDCKDRHGMQ